VNSEFEFMWKETTVLNLRLHSFNFPGRTKESQSGGYNIKIKLRAIDCESMDWIYLAQSGTVGPNVLLF
jgi:hypothetical protein